MSTRINQLRKELQRKQIELQEVANELQRAEREELQPTIERMIVGKYFRYQDGDSDSYHGTCYRKGVSVDGTICEYSGVEVRNGKSGVLAINFIIKAHTDAEYIGDPISADEWDAAMLSIDSQVQNLFA